MNDDTNLGMQALRDDGGRALPTTPEDLLHRAQGVRRRRRAAIVAGTAAVSLAITGFLAAPVLSQSEAPIANTTTTPAPVRTDPPVTPPAEDLHAYSEALSAVQEAMYDGSRLRTPAWEDVLFAVDGDPDSTSRTVKLWLYAGPDAGLVATVQKTLGDGGYVARGVQLEVKQSPYTREQLEQASREAKQRVAQLRRQGADIGEVSVHFDAVKVLVSEGDYEQVRAAFADLGDQVQIRATDS